MGDLVPASGRTDGRTDGTLCLRRECQKQLDTMERWCGRVALVTGASAGIGAAIAEELVKKGLKVVGLARRKEKLQVLVDKLKGTDTTGELHAIACDVTKEEEILDAFTWIKTNLGGVDILVNNAGVVNQAFLTDGDTSEWRQMLEVNVLALSICTREAVRDMKARAVTDGHIVHINSISGHGLPQSNTMFFMYGATKNAVTQLTEGLRRELNKLNTKIRVSSISPGLVRTEIMDAGKIRTFTSREVYANNPSLDPKDIADAVLFVLATPPHVQIHEMTIIPTGQKY